MTPTAPDLVEEAMAWVDRTCLKCGITKGLDAFYADKGSRDGRRSTCKACMAEAFSAYRRANRDKVNAYRREWRAKHPGAESARQRRRKAEKHDEVRASQQRYRDSDLRKEAARCRARRALKSGRISKVESCQRCGRSGRLEMSHNDYDKALEVEFLCVTCHRRKDAINANA